MMSIITKIHLPVYEEQAKGKQENLLTKVKVSVQQVEVASTTEPTQLEKDLLQLLFYHCYTGSKKMYANDRKKSPLVYSCIFGRDASDAMRAQLFMGNELIGQVNEMGPAGPAYRFQDFLTKRENDRLIRWEAGGFHSVVLKEVMKRFEKAGVLQAFTESVDEKEDTVHLLHHLRLGTHTDMAEVDLVAHTGETGATTFCPLTPTSLSRKDGYVGVSETLKGLFAAVTNICTVTQKFSEESYWDVLEDSSADCYNLTDDERQLAVWVNRHKSFSTIGLPARYVRMLTEDERKSFRDLGFSEHGLATMSIRNDKVGIKGLVGKYDGAVLTQEQALSDAIQTVLNNTKEA